MVLLHPAWSAGGSQLLRRLRAARPRGSPLWSFTGAEFSHKFATLLQRLPAAPTAIPCQCRHGAAPHAAAIDGASLADLQERRRHTAPGSTLRYRKHIQYLRLLEDVPPALIQWTDLLERQLGPLLAGREKPTAPSCLTARG